MCQQESIKPRDSNNFSMSHLTYVEKNISEIQNAQRTRCSKGRFWPLLRSLCLYIYIYCILITLFVFQFSVSPLIRVREICYEKMFNFSLYKYERNREPSSYCSKISLNEIKRHTQRMKLVLNCAQGKLPG